MKRFFETKYGTLLFSLLSGLAYFALALSFILGNTGRKGIILGIFFCPAIVCGMALVLIKAIRAWQEQEQYKRITMLAIFHVLLMIFSVIYLLVSVM